MDILKLAKHLKKFTPDEIEMIAEENCKTELEQLLNEHKLSFNNGLYKFVEKEISIDYEIFTTKEASQKDLVLENAIKDFMQNYVKNHCKEWTIQKYKSIFKCNIIPFLRNKKLNDLSIDDIKFLYNKFKELNFKPLRIKNTLALLNQLLKYYQYKGVIDNKCVFQVKRITHNNEFDINRLLFKENL